MKSLRYCLAIDALALVVCSPQPSAMSSAPGFLFGMIADALRVGNQEQCGRGRPSPDSPV